VVKTKLILIQTKNILYKSLLKMIQIFTIFYKYAYIALFIWHDSITAVKNTETKSISTNHVKNTHFNQ